MVKLTAPTNSRKRKTGAVVDVPADKVDALLSRGFTKQSSAPAKKSAAKKSK